MNTVSIEIKNDIAYNILENLEQMDAIKIVKNEKVPLTEEQLREREKIARSFAGCLSAEDVAEMKKELVQMRNEWERDIF